MKKIKLVTIILSAFLFKISYILAADIHRIKISPDHSMVDKVKADIVRDDLAEKQSLIDQELKKTNYESLKQEISLVKQKIIPIRKKLVALKRVQKLGTIDGQDIAKTTQLEIEEKRLKKRESILQSQIDQILEEANKKASMPIGIDAYMEYCEKVQKDAHRETENLKNQTKNLEYSLESSIAETKKLKEHVLKSREEELQWKRINQERKKEENKELAEIKKDIEELERQQNQREENNSAENASISGSVFKFWTWPSVVVMAASIGVIGKKFFSHTEEHKPSTESDPPVEKKTQD